MAYCLLENADGIDATGRKVDRVAAARGLEAERRREVGLSNREATIIAKGQETSTTSDKVKGFLGR